LHTLLLLALARPLNLTVIIHFFILRIKEKMPLPGLLPAFLNITAPQPTGRKMISKNPEKYINDILTSRRYNVMILDEVII